MGARKARARGVRHRIKIGEIIEEEWVANMAAELGGIKLMSGCVKSQYLNKMDDGGLLEG